MLKWGCSICLQMSLKSQNVAKKQLQEEKVMERNLVMKHHLMSEILSGQKEEGYTLQFVLGCLKQRLQ